MTLVLGAWVTMLAGAPHPPASVQVPSMSTDSPRVELEVPREARAGEGIPMKLRVTNTGDQALTLRLRGRPIAFDLIVSREGGSVVWRRLEGAMIAMVLQVRTLGAGETLLLEDTWRPEVTRGAHLAPGDYKVVGELPTDSPTPLRTSPSPLRILGP